ncbi:hypothetical protein BH20VER3_BH20VER3_19960 [soil metagenome]
MAALLICFVSPKLPLRRLAIPGVAFLASIASSVYLTDKLVIHFALQFCATHTLAPTSVRAHLFVEICIYAAGAALFLAVERPFLLLGQRVAGWRSPRE